MNEEIRKILELLEQGKITVEEAERLIAALQSGGSRVEQEPPHDYSDRYGRKRSRGSNGFDGFEESIEEFVKGILRMTFGAVAGALHFIPGLSEAFSEAVGEIDREDYSEYVDKGYIVIRSTGDDVHLKTDHVNVDPGVYRTSRMVVPENAHVLVVSMGGDVHARGNFEEIRIKTLGGDAHFRGHFRRLFANTLGGDMELETPIQGLTLHIYTLGGDVDIPEGYLREGNTVVYGEPDGREARIKTTGGDFILEDMG